MQPQTLFTNYIIAGITALLARVQAAAYVVPEADRQQAWHLLSFGLKLDDAWPVTRELLLALAPKMELAGFREEWIPYLEKGIQCAQKVGDGMVAAECELQIGMLYRLLSRFEDADQCVTASVTHFTAHENKFGQTRALNELAWIKHLQHRLEKASQLATQALSLQDGQGPEQAMSYRVLGMIALQQNDLPKGEQYHRKSLAIFEQVVDVRRKAWSQQNLALALCWQGKFHESFVYYHEASKTLETLEDINHWAIVQMNLGSAYYRYGDLETALTCLYKSEIIAQKFHSKLEMAKIYTHLGLVHLALENFTESENAFHAAIREYEELGDRGWQINAMDGLAMTFLAAQQPKQAIAIIQQALVLLPDIFFMPNYEYLRNSLTKHLHEAEQQIRQIDVVEAASSA